METIDLLRRWHAGDASALDALLAQHLSWIQQTVRRRLGPALRAKVESGDLVQEALVDFLRCGPKFEIHDPAQLRAFLARIVENAICDQAAYHAAKKRGAPQALPDDSVLALDGPRAPVTRPSEHLARAEQAALMDLALRLMAPEDRAIILMRQEEELSFVAIAERLGIQEEAARARFNRALKRLGKRVVELGAGRVADALQ